jgi:hypothetical protein
MRWDEEGGQATGGGEGGVTTQAKGTKRVHGASTQANKIETNKRNSKENIDARNL